MLRDVEPQCISLVMTQEPQTGKPMQTQPKIEPAAQFRRQDGGNTDLRQTGQDAPQTGIPDEAAEALVGLDVGSVSVKAAALGPGGRLAHWVYRRHKGRPMETAAAVIQELLERWPRVRAAATGGSGKALSAVLDIPYHNELLACVAGCRSLAPEARCIFEMGGEDSKFILLDGDAVADFSLNSVCAAGTGSFLDQQAERMQLSIEKFSQLALESVSPPRIAGRCSVFAKSDMIHLQQIATPVQDIVAGLCFAVARNFQGAIVRNRPVPEPVAFLGGVALNPGMARAMREVFGLEQLIVPAPPTVLAAAGAALRAGSEAAPLRRETLDKLHARRRSAGQGKRPLAPESDDFRSRHLRGPDAVRSDLVQAARGTGERITGWLGIDVGSISTCLAVTDDAGEVLCKRYLRTASRPLEALRQGLLELQQEIGPTVDIQGVGTTGSGRYMIADFIDADVVKNEITAQARGAAHIDPEVDTIFEIGGQDSKYIQLKDGIITNFEMNKACAAGTGSFLEEQAEKLAVSVKDEFAALALDAASPCRLGERCTVFMENSLRRQLFKGAARDELLAGLAYSIVENYLNRVVAGRSIGKRVFFQGGTAFNKAVVAAFEKHLDMQITVPPHHDNTGAVGMALIARDTVRARGEKSRFRGFALAERPYALASFECKGCDNRCEINTVQVEGEDRKLFYGGRCEKYDMRQDKPDLPDLFAAREDALEAVHQERLQAFAQAGRLAPLGRIGVPRVFFMHEYLPFYTELLWELGFEPVVSPRTTHAIASLGVKAALADTCFPIKAALGHASWFQEQNIAALFAPSFVNMAWPDSPYDSAQACPLTQSFPYQLRAALGAGASPMQIIAPPVDLRTGRKAAARALAESLAPLGVSRASVDRAMAPAAEAQDRFFAQIQAMGRQALADARSSGRRTLIIMGRAYNAFDRAMNLDIPKKLASLNVQAVPMDFLPEQDVQDSWPEMYWRSGQRLLSAARCVAARPELHAVYIGSFSCGPDSFIGPFVDQETAGKPYLHLEIDEHSADAGMITRCEAFLDSLDMQEKAAAAAAPAPRTGAGQPRRRTAYERARRTVYIPRMCDHAFGLEAAFKACGVDAEVLPETDAEAVALARKFVSGKECYPFAVTTGDMLTKAFSPGFDPSRSAFLMWSGSGPCRFGQYNVLQRMILDKAGFGQAAVFSPMQDSSLYSEVGDIGKDFARKSWEGVVAVDLLTRCLHETRPYARQPQEAEAAYAEGLELIRSSLCGRHDALLHSLGGIRRSFEDIERTPEPRPRIGVVGEIFVRSNRFSNENLIRRVEELGGECWLAPIEEWIYYVNWCSQRNAAMRKEWKKLLQVKLKNHFQTRIGRRMEAVFDGFLQTIHDPSAQEVLDKAAPYLHHSFRGEAVLSMGKTMDMLSRGVSGVINAIPFGCMPGTVVTAMLRSVSQQYGLPVISAPYDGGESPTLDLQLETFMEQAQERFARSQQEL